MKLTDHFTLEEMTRSQTAARRGLDNTAGPAARAALTRLCQEVLEPIRAHFGRPVNVSSGYRAPAVNKAIGGAATSQHCLGEAADITVPGVSNLELAQWIMRNLKYDQLILEFGQWVHVSFGRRMRQQELTARHENGRTVYHQGLQA